MCRACHKSMKTRPSRPSLYHNATTPIGSTRPPGDFRLLQDTGHLRPGVFSVLQYAPVYVTPAILPARSGGVREEIPPRTNRDRGWHVLVPSWAYTYHVAYAYRMRVHHRRCVRPAAQRGLRDAHKSRTSVFSTAAHACEYPFD